MRRVLLSCIALALVFAIVDSADAKNPIRRDFFSYYPSVDASVIAVRSDGSDHCGMCHFDFNGPLALLHGVEVAHSPLLDLAVHKDIGVMELTGCPV